VRSKRNQSLATEAKIPKKTFAGRGKEKGRLVKKSEKDRQKKKVNRTSKHNGKEIDVKIFFEAC